jgi:hypothetical protein
MGVSGISMTQRSFNSPVLGSYRCFQEIRQIEGKPGPGRLIDHSNSPSAKFTPEVAPGN